MQELITSSTLFVTAIAMLQMFRKIRDGTQMNFITSTLIRNSSLSEVRHNFPHLEMRRLRERRTAVESTQQNTAESSLHTHTHVARGTTHPAFRKPASQCQKNAVQAKDVGQHTGPARKHNIHTINDIAIKWPRPSHTTATITDFVRHLCRASFAAASR